MRQCIHNEWHAWDGNGCIFLSDEFNRVLRSFPGIQELGDFLINVVGDAEAAEAIAAKWRKS